MNNENKDTKPEIVSPEDFAGLLFNIHHHDKKTEEIIYYEKDLLPILRAIGLPEPKWGKCLTLKEYSENKK